MPLEGYKTHIVAIMVALVALAEGLLGVDIPGAEMQADWLNWVGGALGLSALRSGVSSSK